MQMRKPSSELKKVDYFAGNWTTEGDMKPGPMGPGGKMIMTERNQWMEGGFFLTMQSEFKVAGLGSGTGMAYIGYESDKKIYTYDEFNSMGEVQHSTGTVEGDTWNWNGKKRLGDSTMKTRFVIKTLSPTSYTFKLEMSLDGNKWSTVMDGKATKDQF
jgi:Protein of unknown function (DUF1579)